ncbi:hypothetical protein HHI36_009686 [Cryptolaemus montrouzieri]|uniref:Uncharacterized protein n=1 Tax=Cryptolaemus montrouzieri TaxID=559131 RepID=A0ABD2MGZ6_9CUCU
MVGYLKKQVNNLVHIMPLERRAKAKNEIVVGEIKYLRVMKIVLSKEPEKELVDYIKGIETRMYGLTKEEQLSLAYQLAEKNNIPHQFHGGKAEYRSSPEIDFSAAATTENDLDQGEPKLQEPPRRCVSSAIDLINEDPSHRSASPDMQQLLSLNVAESVLESLREHRTP